MSLTKDDLLAIGSLIDERLEKKLDEKLSPISVKLQDLSDEQQKQGAEQTNQRTTLQYLKKKVNKIEKTVDIIGRTYDERITKNTRDIEKIKIHSAH